MNPITNSLIKERFRQDEQNQAKNQESQILNKLSQDISALKTKNKCSVSGFIVVGAIAGGVIGAMSIGFYGIPFGALAGLGIWFAYSASINNYNGSLEARKRELTQKANMEISAAYAASDQRTIQKINSYDADVKAYCQKILKNAEGVSPMVDSTTNMFQRMISHANHGTYMRFIETDFTFNVSCTGIEYNYQSTYTNPMDNFNFKVERYRDLTSDAECEGLAQALAKLTAAKMKTLYPANSMKISVNHMDAKVTMHFQGANANFIPARDIL